MILAKATVYVRAETDEQIDTALIAIGQLPEVVPGVTVILFETDRAVEL